MYVCHTYILLNDQSHFDTQIRCQVSEIQILERLIGQSHTSTHDWLSYNMCMCLAHTNRTCERRGQVQKNSCLQQGYVMKTMMVTLILQSQPFRLVKNKRNIRIKTFSQRQLLTVVDHSLILVGMQTLQIFIGMTKIRLQSFLFSHKVSNLASSL